MRTAPDDLLFLSARLSSTAQLLEVLLGPLPPGRVGALVELLGLRGPALAAALEADLDGPILLAALELGRRAAVSPLGRGVEIRGPAEAAGIAFKVWARCERGPLALALDGSGALARARPFTDDVEALRAVVGAGCARLLVVAPSGEFDDDGARDLQLRSRAVDVELEDVVLVDERGLISARRRGILAGSVTSP